MVAWLLRNVLYVTRNGIYDVEMWIGFLPRYFYRLAWSRHVGFVATRRAKALFHKPYQP